MLAYALNANICRFQNSLILCNSWSCLRIKTMDLSKYYFTWLPFLLNILHYFKHMATYVYATPQIKSLSSVRPMQMLMSVLPQMVDAPRLVWTRLGHSSVTAGVEGVLDQMANLVQVNLSIESKLTMWLYLWNESPCQSVPPESQPHSRCRIDWVKPQWFSR